MHRHKSVSTVVALFAWSCGAAFSLRTTVAAAPAAAPRATPLAALLQTPQNIAPQGCTTGQCHQKEKNWSEKLDGDGKTRQHLNAFDQLDSKRYPNVAKYLTALGLKNNAQYDPKGTCVQCHGTVVQNDANDGVTCQSCHGPGSLYNKPHQETGAYDRQVPLPGMLLYIGKPDKWAEPVCFRCHVLGQRLTDAPLAAAGHPSGVGETDFTLSKKFSIIAPHWKDAKKYSAAQFAPYDAVRNRIAAALVTKAPPVATATPAAPPPVVVSPVPPVTPPPVAGSPPAVPPVAPPVVTTLVRTPPAPPIRTPPATVPPSVVTATVTPTVVRPAPVPPVPTMPAPPVVAAPQAVAPPPPAAGAPYSQSPVALVSALQGRLILLLQSLLTQNVSRSITPPAAPATSYTGPSAEILRLQQEVIALALQALATEPKSARPAKPDSGQPAK